VPRVHGGDTGDGRRRRLRSVSTSLAEINVVPLVDVMLVLLVIFMVTAPMMQRGLDVRLPRARHSSIITDDRIFVTVPLSFRKDRIVQLGDERIRIDVLAERVRQALVSRTDRQVFLRGDGGVVLDELMEVFDRLKDAGVEDVGIVTRLVERGR
jgi:biopolymer transport protein ExbD